MEATDHASEGDPLKRGEDGGEAGTAPHSTDLKKSSCKETLGLSKLTHWRTGVFFLSLFLCLTVVFAFSFIIPCPVRPQYLSIWNRTFSDAATYDFLDIQRANDDMVMDILFAFKSNEGTQNSSCSDSGLPSPCLFLTAVDGTDGETLWEHPLPPEFHWAQCGLEAKTGRNWDCLLHHAEFITAINKHTGELLWRQPQPTSLRSSVPVLSLPDLDEDKVGDLALVGSDNTQTQLVLLSGKTGEQIGSTVVLDFPDKANHLLHRTAGGSFYVVLQTETGLFGLSLKRVATKAGVEAGLKEDKLWEKAASPTSGLVPIYESDSVRHVLTKDDADGSTGFVVVTETDVALVDSKELQLLWSFNTSSVLSLPSFGHFNKDELLDVVIEEDVGNDTKRIVIVDGTTGGVLWETNLRTAPNSPQPASVHTINSVSVFMFWGSLPSETNSSVPLTVDRHSYLMYPLYSRVLLEYTNTLDHIITFKATLMERGRHAAYMLLTGPESEGAEGTVVLSKRKLKQDVPFSKVCRIDIENESDDKIKEAFNRLRFSDW